MADTVIRAQVAPRAGVDTLLYAAVGSTVVSTIRACNTGRATDYIRIRKAFAGEALADAQYLVYSVAVPPGQPYALTEGEGLLEDDAIYVLSLNGSTSFNISGVKFS